MKKFVFQLTFLAVIALTLLIYSDPSANNLAQVVSTVQQRISTARVISGPFKITTPKGVNILLGIEVFKDGGLSHKFILEKGGWEVIYDPKLNAVTVFDGLNKRTLTTFTPASNQVSIELVEKLPSGERSAEVKNLESKPPEGRSTRINP